jgi:tetratricopeptide (TPR) repeat protein
MRREGERGRRQAPQSDTGNGIVPGGYEPCLLAVVRLSLGRHADTRPTTGWFLQALARTGHLARAAELAYTISNELQQGEALLGLVEAAADAGDLSGAQRLAERVPLRQRDEALLALVRAWARVGERDRATALAERIRYPHNWGKAWATLAKVAADNGDAHEALRCADRADAEVSSSAFAETGQVLALLVEVATAMGDHVRAATLADRVEDFDRSGNPTAWSWPQPRPLATVLACEVLRGDLDRVDALLRPTLRAPLGAEGRTSLPAPRESPGQDAAGQGDLDEVIVCPRPVRSPLDAWDMACLLDAVAETADQEVALALADRAEALLDTDVGYDHDNLLRAVTLLLARRGHVERAMALVDEIDPAQRAGRHAQIVGELARYGDTTRAETLARTITDREAQGAALIDVVRGLAQRGDLRRAETLARTITDRGARAGALASLAELSEPPGARRLAAQVVVLDGWATALTVLERIAPRAVATVADHMMS